MFERFLWIKVNAFLLSSCVSCADATFCIIFTVNRKSSNKIRSEGGIFLKDEDKMRPVLNKEK